MTRISRGDLVQVVESRHPALRGRQVVVEGVVVRHVSDEGDTSGTVQAVETRVPVWRVGEVVTEEMGEPPVGSVVRDLNGQGYDYRREGPEQYRNRRSPWNKPGTDEWYSWDYLTGRPKSLILVSLPDRPTEAHKASPTPEVREVPLSELREGDVLTVTGTVTGLNAGWAHINGDVFQVPYMRPDLTVTATRPAPQLPITPGKVGTATVRYESGQSLTRVIALDLFGQWYEVIDREPVSPEQITDFVELLAGEVK